MGRELANGEGKRKKRVMGEERERWGKWLRAEALVGGEKKSFRASVFALLPVLPLREVGRWFSAVQGPNRLYRGEK